LGRAAVQVRSRATRRRGRLSQRGSFALLTVAFGSLGASSTVPTPLYGVYQDRWGFSPITTTVVFAVYAVAVLATLLTVGGLSDHVGRRPMMVGAVCLQALGAVMFIVAQGVPELVIARVAQGVGAGIGTPALAAALLDLDPERGAIANAVSPLLGSACGSLLSGVFVQYLPWRMTLVYVVLLVLLVSEGLGTAVIGETSPRAAGWLSSLRPRLSMPVAARRAVLLTAPLLVAIWMLFGFYGSLGPSLLYRISGSSSIALGGLTLFVFGGTAAGATVSLRALPPVRVMGIAASTLLVGVAICLTSVASGSIALFLAAAVASGVGFGAGLQAALRIVLPHAAAAERAGLASTLYVIMYVALGVPAVAAGFLVVDGGGLKRTAYIYGVTLIALGGFALNGLRPRAKRAGAINF